MEKIYAGDGIFSKYLKWIAVDLDGTLAESIWPAPGIGAPLPGAIESMKKIAASGDKVIIYTARPWSHYSMIEDWCKLHEIPVREIICGKPLFKWIIDDKNVEFNGDWKQVTDKLGL